MFGSANQGSMFGAKPAPAGGLFGNSTNNNNNAGNTAGGSFGSNTGSNSSFSFGAPKPATPGGGLFGSSNASASSNPAPSMFESNPTSNNTASSGLFSNAPKPVSLSLGGASTNGLFGSAAPAASGSLFGNSSSGFANKPTATSGSLFGNSSTAPATGGGLFSQPAAAPAATGGLFGNSNSNGTLGGLFGNTASSGAGLFGSSSSANTANAGFFGGQNSGAANATPFNAISGSNPYNYDTTFLKIRQDLSQMPQSITKDLFEQPQESKKRSSSTFSIPTSSSLLSKLGQTLRFFRSSSPTADKPDSILSGIFTPTDYINYNSINRRDFSGKEIFRRKDVKSESLKVKKPLDIEKVSDVKRLVIKTKPLKFHLIDTDKVFNTKRRRVLIGTESVLLSDKILSGDNDFDADADAEVQIFDDDLNRKYKSNSNKHTKTQPEEKPKDDSWKLDDKEINKGYWCIPSIAEISKMSMSELTEVQNFTIGRDGCGQISYDLPVDASTAVAVAREEGKTLNEILFDNIFQFEDNIVLVYQKLVKQPPMGSGFNFPATISIANKFPNKAKGESVSDFVKKLKRSKGEDFVTYEPNTGTWVFRVLHFSIWGVVDNDADENMIDPSIVSAKRRQDENEDESRIEASRIYGNEFSDEIKRQKLRLYANNVPGAWDSQSDLQMQNNALQFKRTLVKEEVQQQLLLSQEDKRLIGDEVADITIDEEQDILTSPKLFNDEPSIDDVLNVGIAESHYEIDDTYALKNEKLKYIKQLVSVLPRNIDLADMVSEKVFEPEITNENDFNSIENKANRAVSNDWLVQLELANDFNSSLNPLQYETGEKGINTEVMDRLLFGDNFNKNAETPAVQTKKHEDVPKIGPQTDFGISKIIKDFVFKSTIGTNSNGYPTCKKIEYTFKNLVDLNSASNSEEEALFKLCFALFCVEEIPNVNKDNTSLLSHLQELKKRTALINWFKEYNSNKKLPTDDIDVTDEIFHQVCLGNVENAIELSMTSNNGRLASLLTLLDANDASVRDTATAQLNYWDAHQSTKLIPGSIKKIFEILAGNFDVVSMDLPWHFALSINYLYGNTSVRLEELIDSYLPSEEEKSSFSEIFKVYGLIKNLQISQAFDVLENSSLSTSLKWVIAAILSSENSFEVPNSITLKFGDYLRQNGLLKDAIYAYSFLKDSVESEKLIRKVVFQGISEIDVNDKYLLSVLKVPQTLVYEAMAEASFNRKDYWEQCNALVKANLWREVADCISTYIGPITVISNNKESALKLLAIVQQIPNQGLIIPNWLQTAGVYVQFVELVEQREAGIQINTLFDSLLVNIPLVKNVSELPKINVVALKTISKAIGDIAIAQGDVPVDKILSLVLGENEKQYFNVRLDTTV